MKPDCSFIVRETVFEAYLMEFCMQVGVFGDSLTVHFTYAGWFLSTLLFDNSKAGGIHHDIVRGNWFVIRISIVGEGGVPVWGIN